jgi:hypothetical protein
MLLVELLVHNMPFIVLNLLNLLFNSYCADIGCVATLQLFIIIIIIIIMNY